MLIFGKILNFLTYLMTLNVFTLAFYTLIIMPHILVNMHYIAKWMLNNIFNDIKRLKEIIQRKEITPGQQASRPHIFSKKYRRQQKLLLGGGG